MDYIIIMLFLIIILVIIAIVYEVNLNKLKQFAISEEGKFNKIADKYPSNIEICEIMLKKLKNDKVKVEEDKNAKTSLYIAITDKILIADVKNSYTRIQTIAHECLHSVQSRKILLFNFIYSNIYLLYFFIVTILALFNKLQNGMLYLSIMLILSYTYYFIRSYLENDAMINSKEEVNSIVDSFNKLNNTGIKITNFQLMFETIIKVIILSIAFLI